MHRTHTVPSERLDVVLHPGERPRLVPQAVVARHDGVSSREEAERPDTVVEGDDDDAFGHLTEIISSIDSLREGTRLVASPVVPD